MKQYFIADTHFGHKKYHSENWQNKFWKKYNNINQDFILYILGDLSFVHNHEYLSKIFDSFRKNLFCKNIVLILGNHDDKMSRYIKHGIVTCDLMKIMYKNKEIVLSHVPVNVGNEEINIHGHLHTLKESHRDLGILTGDHILVEYEKIYEIDELLEKSDNNE